jgi:sporulation-control protein
MMEGYPIINKFFASLGFGSAKIDLVLNESHVTMGLPVEGTIYVKGGTTDQEIDQLTVEFCLVSKYQAHDQTRHVHEKVATIPIIDRDFVIHPGEVREFPFRFVCPSGIPVSLLHTRYYFRTHLGIERGVDSKDMDYVQVLPDGILRNFLEGFRSLGFVPIGEGYTGRSHNRMQIIQFTATQWMRGYFDEIVFAYDTSEADQEIRGWFELDKRTSGITGWLADELDLDEKKGRFCFYPNQLATAERAKETIKQFIIDNTKDLLG